MRACTLQRWCERPAGHVGPCSLQDGITLTPGMLQGLRAARDEGERRIRFERRNSRIDGFIIGMSVASVMWVVGLAIERLP